MFSVLLHGTFTVQILHVLYSVQLNCTYSNYTEAAATCSAAQQHRNCPALFCSALQLVLWNCICRHNHIQSSDSSSDAVPHPYSATQYAFKFLPGNCKASFLTSSSIRMWWRNSRTWRDPTWRAGQHLEGAHSQRITLPSICSKHSHWAKPATVTQGHAACGATSHCFQGAIQPAQKWVGGLLWGHWQLVLHWLGFGRPTASAVLMTIMNVTKITDWHTVQTEGQLKYSLCQVQICVKVCQCYPL